MKCERDATAILVTIKFFRLPRCKESVDAEDGGLDDALDKLDDMAQAAKNAGGKKKGVKTPKKTGGKKTKK